MRSHIHNINKTNNTSDPTPNKFVPKCLQNGQSPGQSPGQSHKLSHETSSRRNVCNLWDKSSSYRNPTHRSNSNGWEPVSEYKEEKTRILKESFGKTKATPTYDSSQIVLGKEICTCNGKVCRGNSVVKYNTCIKFHITPDNDSKEVVFVILFGKTERCSQFASEHNQKRGSFSQFYDQIRSEDSRSASDFAFRLLAFNYDELFGMDRLVVERNMNNYKSYLTLVNQILRNVVKKFLESESCGVEEYEDIHTEFDRINKNYGRDFQLNPYFGLSWDIAGNNKIYADSSSISEESGVRLHHMSDTKTKRNFDKGYLPHLLEMLSKNRDSSILLQVMVPDGRWVKKECDPDSRAKRWSDIQFSLSARGKALIHEDMKEAAQREVMEELGEQFNIEAFERSKDGRLFEVNLDEVGTVGTVSK